MRCLQLIAVGLLTGTAAVAALLSGVAQMVMTSWPVVAVICAVLIWQKTGRDPLWWIARACMVGSAWLNAFPYAVRCAMAAWSGQAQILKAYGEGRAPRRNDA